MTTTPFEDPPVRARGRTIWNVNATATGGGVAELLQSFVSYGRDRGDDVRWVVLEGTAPFFALTKRLHHLLHGREGDPRTALDRVLYEQTAQINMTRLERVISPKDVVILHDPQTCGLIPWLRRRGNTVLWRCHIGADQRNSHVDAAWAFLTPYLLDCDALIASRPQHLPPAPPCKTHVIHPAIDPCSDKNRSLLPRQIEDILRNAGVLKHNPALHAPTATVVGGPVPDIARFVLQVSRWDPLKDMHGVMQGFAQSTPTLPTDVHLVLCGPSSAEICDDPEGAEVYQQCLSSWHDLPPRIRRRIHLVTTSLTDPQGNDLLVNALQSRASVVVQKSLMEGFGLTVTEAQWKGRPVLAAAVGGLCDQITDGRSGVLLADPTDLKAFGNDLDRLLRQPGWAKALGERAHQEVRQDRVVPAQYARWQALLGAQHLRSSPTSDLS